MVKLFLDTDMGPDCDDAGALQLIHTLCDQGKAALLGVTHCTSSPYGLPTISAINRFNGREVPLGTTARKGFLIEENCLRYSLPVAEAFDHEFRGGRPQREAREIFEEVVAAQPDESVTVVAIGPLNNLADFVSDEAGVELIRCKVNRLVCMAGRFDSAEPEWNVKSDVAAASAVIKKWPGEIVMCGWECGAGVITGAALEGMAGHPVREAYLDAAGEPVTLEAGYAILERAYDDAGNVTVERYLDRDGLPVTLAEGYAEVRREYDGKHQAILEAYFDGEGNSTLCASGYASTRRRYDDAGDCVQRWFYGVDGSPACTGSGYAQLTRTFNARHQVLTESYYDADGQPMALSSGQHMLEYEYDEAGRVGALRYYGTDLAPVDLSYGFAEVRRSYDGQGRLIREEYYDAQGSPTERREGWFAVETDYDANGGVAQVRYYSTDGTLLKTE